MKFTVQIAPAPLLCEITDVVSVLSRLRACRFSHKLFNIQTTTRRSRLTGKVCFFEGFYLLRAN